VTDGPAGELDERTEESKPDYIRWIPFVVPLGALLIVLCVYLIAAEVLARTGTG
jgi:hypothetical protein